MHKFKDNEGREWSLSLNCWQIKKLKDGLNFDARDQESIFNASTDALLLCNVLYVLCEQQCQERGVSDRQFGEALAGQAIEDATEAYIEETIDFFRPSQRQAIRAVMSKVSETRTRALATIQEKMASPETETAIQKAMTEIGQTFDEILAGTISGKSSGNVPASPA